MILIFLDELIFSEGLIERLTSKQNTLRLTKIIYFPTLILKSIVFGKPDPLGITHDIDKECNSSRQRV